MPSFAYVCTQCHHLASRHYLRPDATDIIQGPYLCSHNECACEISQTTPLTGIDEATFNRNFLPRLDEYGGGGY